MRRARKRLRLVVLGYLLRWPVGVYYVEDSDDYESCYDLSRKRMTTDPTFGMYSASDMVQTDLIESLDSQRAPG